MNQSEQPQEVYPITPASLDSLGDWSKSHDCNTLGRAHIDQMVTVMGWVQRRRDHGGLIFVDLRDREGITQVVFDPQHDAPAHERAHSLRSEFVIAVRGKVRSAPGRHDQPKADDRGD